MHTSPRPRVTAINAPFWEGCNRGVLMLQRCAAEDCARAVFYPRVCCPFCGHGTLYWEQASGAGTVRSVTRVHRPGHDAFLADAPYLFAAVTLAEGPTLYGRLDAGELTLDAIIGRPVRAVFRQVLPDQRLVQFESIP
jgi:uncharacterized protein